MAGKMPIVSVANREVPLAGYIPYSTHVTDHIIKTREGDYVQIWKIAGIAFEAADPADILARHDGFNQFVRGLAGGHVSLWSHRLRRRVSDQFSSQYRNRFCEELATRYYGSFSGYRMMANELYLTVVYRPNRTRLGRVFSRAARRTRDDIRRDQIDALKVMTELAAQVESSLKPYEPIALGVYRRPSPVGRTSRRYSSALELLGYLINGVWEREPVPTGSIREALPISRLFVGAEKVEIRMPTKTRFAAMLDLKDYPEDTEPGMLNGLLYGDFEYIETQSFTILDKPTGKEALERQRNQLIAGEDVAVSQVEAIDQALDELINGNFVLGEYHYSLAVLGDTLDEVSRSIAKARTQLADAGFQTALIDLVADAAWFAQLPANWRYRPREAKLTSRNFCGLASLHNFATGKRDGNPWGEAITIVKTPSGQPLYLNFHATPDKQDSFDEKALANTQIIGRAGAGKTVLELFLLAMATKYGITAVLFDKDRGTEIAIRAMGGTYTVFRRGDRVEQFHVVGRAREHIEHIAEPGEIEPADRGAMALLDEEQAAALAQVAHDIEFRFGQLEAMHVIVVVGTRIRQEEECRALLDQRTRDVTTQHIGRRLSVENPKPVLFADRLLLVFGKIGKDRIAEPLPEFGHHVNEASTINQVLGPMQQVHRDGRRHLGIVQQLGIVETKQVRVRQIDAIGRIVQHPTQTPARTPFRQSRVQAVFTDVRQKLPYHRQAAQRFIHTRDLANSTRDVEFVLRRQRRTNVDKFAHKALPKVDHQFIRRHLERIQPSWFRAQVGDAPHDWLPVFHDELAKRRAAQVGARPSSKPGPGGA